MRKPLHERLAAAELRQAQAAARVAAIKGKQKVADRKRDTRRKIVVGAAVLVEMEREPKFAAYVRSMLGKAVTRPNDLEAVADLLKATADGATPAASNANTPPPPAKSDIPTSDSDSGASANQPTAPAKASFPVTVREKRIPGYF